jgi:hypothetical protein
VLEAGGFSAHEGRTQHINIQDLIGNDYTVTSHTDQNAMIGMSYYLEAYNTDRYSLWYGLSLYHLFPNVVKGTVIQEGLFENLSYQYSTNNTPLYLAAKGLFNLFHSSTLLTINGGIGVNCMQTSSFQENSLDGGITIPDEPFPGNTQAVFSAMFGVGLQFNNIHALGNLPVEIGYRYFYLGKGNLLKPNLFLNNLRTGNTYANALTISVFFA